MLQLPPHQENFSTSILIGSTEKKIIILLSARRSHGAQYGNTFPEPKTHTTWSSSPISAAPEDQTTGLDVQTCSEENVQTVRLPLKCKLPPFPPTLPFFTVASLYPHYSFPQASLCLYKDKQLFSASRRMLPLRVFLNVTNLGKADDLQIQQLPGRYCAIFCCQPQGTYKHSFSSHRKPVRKKKGIKAFPLLLKNLVPSFLPIGK